MENETMQILEKPNDIYLNTLYKINVYNTLFTQYASSSTISQIQLVLDMLPDGPNKETRASNILKCVRDGYVNKEIFRLNDIRTYKVKMFKCGCNSRLCPNCMAVYMRRERANNRSKLDLFGKSRFMTTSFKNVNRLTNSYLKSCFSYQRRLREYLARERRLSYFNRIIDSSDLPHITKESIKLNIYNNSYIKTINGKEVRFYRCATRRFIQVLEIKFNKKGDVIKDRDTHKKIGFHQEDNWNAHFHSIYEGDFIPEVIAREFLKKITKKESFYVDIRYIGQDSIREKAKAFNYITKYLSKMVFKSDDYALSYEYYTAIKNIQFISYFNCSIPIIKYFGSLKAYLNTVFKMPNSHIFTEYLEVKAFYAELFRTLDSYQGEWLDLSQDVESNACQYASDTFWYDQYILTKTQTEE